MKSLERYLLAWILGALCIGSIALAAFSYIFALDEINEAFDADLTNVAKVIAGLQRNSPVVRDTSAKPPADPDDESEILVVLYTLDGQRLHSSDPKISLPFTTTEGLVTKRVGSEDWIIYTDVQGDSVGQAAQRVSSRQLMAAEAARKMVGPLIILIFFIAALFIFALRRGLRPLDRAAVNLADRSARSLNPIPEHEVPQEMKPLVHSINDLLGRLDKSFSAQRHFLASAAHQLRTPITAIRLQLQLLQKSPSPQASHESISELAHGIDRLQHIVEQLLDVARTEPGADRVEIKPMALDELVRQAVGARHRMALDKQIDLGAVGNREVRINGDADQLRLLVENLLDNSLRYAPTGSIVDAITEKTSDGRAVLRVTDNGPGMPASERATVFEKFNRGADELGVAADIRGKGLGFVIVKAVAHRHGAQLSLHENPQGRGLEVRVTFPLAA